MKRPTWIPVVTALIRKDQKILLGQRPEGLTLAGQWEFPGGKLELGESPREALHRELKEELGIDAKIGDLRIANSHTFGDKGILILFFDVFYWKGEPKNLHHTQLEWVDVNEIPEREIPDTNRKMIDEIMEILKD